MGPVRRRATPRALLAALTATWLGCHGDATPPAGAPPAAPAALAWPALDEPGLVAWAATEGYTLGAPVPLAIAPDGSVVFTRARPRDPSADLYQLDPAGKLSVLATAAALLATAPVADADRAAAARGITAAELSADGARLLVAVAGRAFVIERSTGAARELALGVHRDVHLAPDGSAVAFVRDGDLWVAALGAGAPATPVRLTQHPPERSYAVAEPGAVAFGRDRGYWWSPDSQAIAFQRTDARAVAPEYAGDPRPRAQPPAAVQRARPGQPIATVDLGVVPARGGAPRWITWDVARYPYLAQVRWSAHAPLTVLAVGRDQTQLAAIADAPAGGPRVLVVDKDPAWVNVAPDALTWLPDGAGFLWMTEAHGAWALEHRAADGALIGTLVAADVGLRRVVGLAPGDHDVVIEAAADPRAQHVWRVPLTGGAPLPLTAVAGGGIHRAWTGAGALVIASALRGGGGTTIVIRGDARRELPSVAEHPRAPTTQIDTAALDDHIQDVAITRPRALDPAVRYPVVLRIAGDPDAKAVRDALDDYVLDQWLADAGFIVVRTDGRGTPGHDRIWQRAIAGDVVTLPLNDQLGALKQLGARYPELDTARTAAIGAGRGGHLAALGVLLHPDAFAAGVATAPITDWALLDAAVAERTMRTPATNAEGYRRASAASYAEQLKRPLLMIAGDGMALAHSLALIDALSAAGNHVEFATAPAVADLAQTLAAHTLALGFLRDRLGPPVRPAVMPKPKTEEEEEEEEREHRGDKDRGGKDKDRGDKDKDRR